MSDGRRNAEGVGMSAEIRPLRDSIEPATAARMAAGLHTIAKGIERGDVNPPKAVVVLTLDADGVPNGWVWGAGGAIQTTNDEIRRLMHHASFEITPRRFILNGEEVSKPTTFDERLKASHARSVAVAGVMDAKKADEARAKPWLCEFCGKRYATERGAVAHERSCLTAPRDAEHKMTAGYTVAGGHVLSCRCGWVTPPGKYGASLNAALRAHMNEHAPTVVPFGQDPTPTATGHVSGCTGDPVTFGCPGCIAHVGHR